MHDVEVGSDDLLDTGSLHLQGDLAAVLEGSYMHLGDGGAGDWDLLDLGEDLIQGLL